MSEAVVPEVVGDKPKRRRMTTPKVKPAPGDEVAKAGGALAVPRKGVTLLEMGVSPEDVIDIGVSIANKLQKIIDPPEASKKLYTAVRGKRHVHVEGWTTMGAMLGIFPREVESKQIDEKTWEATVELIKISDGSVIGRASHICSKRERMWKSREEYAVKSMAATRATGKAFRLGFSWIMVLAGYSPTPNEEMQFDMEAPVDAPFADEDKKPAQEPEPYVPPKPDPQAVYLASKEQKHQLAKMFEDVELFDKTSLSLISAWLKTKEYTFAVAGDLVFLLKKHQITLTELPIIANSIPEMDIDYIEKYIAEFKGAKNA